MIDVPNISSSDVIAFLALLIAVYSAWHQRAVNATQQRVNEFLLQQGENCRYVGTRETSSVNS